jgi:hypothetical protein
MNKLTIFTMILLLLSFTVYADTETTLKESLAHNYDFRTNSGSILLDTIGNIDGDIISAEWSSSNITYIPYSLLFNGSYSRVEFDSSIIPEGETHSIVICQRNNEDADEGVFGGQRFLQDYSILFNTESLSYGDNTSWGTSSSSAHTSTAWECLFALNNGTHYTFYEGTNAGTTQEGSWVTGDIEQYYLGAQSMYPLGFPCINCFDYDGEVNLFQVFNKTLNSTEITFIDSEPNWVCEASWVCDGYDSTCTDDSWACDSASDINQCGETYLGNYSEFEDGYCCISDWLCGDYEDCQNGLQTCDYAIDLGLCSIAYDGDYSDLGVRECGDDSSWTQYNGEEQTGGPTFGLNGQQNYSDFHSSLLIANDNEYQPLVTDADNTGNSEIFIIDGNNTEIYDNEATLLDSLTIENLSGHPAIITQNGLFSNDRPTFLVHDEEVIYFIQYVSGSLITQATVDTGRNIEDQPFGCYDIGDRVCLLKYEGGLVKIKIPDSTYSSVSITYHDYTEQNLTTTTYFDFGDLNEDGRTDAAMHKNGGWMVVDVVNMSIIVQGSYPNAGSLNWKTKEDIGFGLTTTGYGNGQNHPIIFKYEDTETRLYFNVFWLRNGYLGLDNFYDHNMYCRESNGSNCSDWTSATSMDDSCTNGAGGYCRNSVTRPVPIGNKLCAGTYEYESVGIISPYIKIGAKLFCMDDSGNNDIVGSNSFTEFSPFTNQWEPRIWAPSRGFTTANLNEGGLTDIIIGSGGGASSGYLNHYYSAEVDNRVSYDAQGPDSRSSFNIWVIPVDINNDNILDLVSTRDGMIGTYLSDSGACGNGLKEGLEECDTYDFDHETCDSQGREGYNLLCDSNCNFDYSSCLEVKPNSGSGNWPSLPVFITPGEEVPLLNFFDFLFELNFEKIIAFALEALTKISYGLPNYWWLIIIVIASLFYISKGDTILGKNKKIKRGKKR